MPGIVREIKNGKEGKDLTVEEITEKIKKARVSTRNHPGERDVLLFSFSHTEPIIRRIICNGA